MFDAKYYDEKCAGLETGRRIIYLDSTGSTNEVCIDMREPECAIAARTQTSGRGRHGKSFFSPEGGLYISWFARDPLCPGLTVKAAVAAAQALEELGVAVGIKWLNDLKYDGKKVCGILAQKTRGGAALGMGFNLRTEFPAGLSDIAGNLPEGVDETELATAVAIKLNELLPLPTARAVELYKPRCETIGKKVWCQTLGKEAVALDVDPEGRLITDMGIVSSGMVE